VSEGTAFDAEAGSGASGRPEDVSGLARATAQQAYERLRGGLALVFLIDPQDLAARPRLRAGAGLDGPDAARRAGLALLPAVRSVLEQGGSRAFAAPRELGAAAAGGVVAIALEWGGRRFGALVAAAALSPADEAARRDLQRVAQRLAERLDHHALATELQALKQALQDREDQTESKGEEILKLSEALFAQDIELLRKDEKLGKVERLKNDFIEKMSCELRTPLNGIIEAIIGVLANENDALSDAAKAGLRSALDDGTSFLRTLQNILDLWRVKQSELPVELHEVNFREVVDEAIFSVQDTLGGKEIRIEKRFEEPFPKIRTDLSKANQILFLLLDNAAKFTEQGRIEIRSEVRDGELVCAIEDTGIGICPDDQQFIFDAFYQVDEPNSTRFRGAGLGLALVRDLVTLLGGSLETSSEVGRGSTFVFRLPVQIVS
jgi:signal transduction histidine kinase